MKANITEKILVGNFLNKVTKYEMTALRFN